MLVLYLNDNSKIKRTASYVIGRMILPRGLLMYYFLAISGCNHLYLKIVMISYSVLICLLLVCEYETR